MAFADCLNAEARELAAGGVDVIQFDEPAFNVYMKDVKDWGIEALHRAIDGVGAKTAAALDAHRATDHFKKYQTTTANMVAKRDVRGFSSVAMNMKGM